MTESSQTTEKSISDTDFRQMWQELTHNQQRFAIAMLDAPTKKEAAVSIQILPDTAYRWNGVIDDVIAFMRTQAKEAAIGILADKATKAAMVKVAGLDSDDEIRRQDAATEVLDRVLGRATQRQEHTGKDGGPIKTESNSSYGPTEHARAIAALVQALRPDSDQADGGEQDAVDATVGAPVERDSEPSG